MVVKLVKKYLKQKALMRRVPEEAAVYTLPAFNFVVKPLSSSVDNSPETRLYGSFNSKEVNWTSNMPYLLLKKMGFF